MPNTSKCLCGLFKHMWHQSLGALIALCRGPSMVLVATNALKSCRCLPANLLAATGAFGNMYRCCFLCAYDWAMQVATIMSDSFAWDSSSPIAFSSFTQLGQNLDTSYPSSAIRSDCQSADQLLCLLEPSNLSLTTFLGANILTPTCHVLHSTWATVLHTMYCLLLNSQYEHCQQMLTHTSNLAFPTWAC